MNTLQQMFPNMGKGITLCDSEVLKPYTLEVPFHEFYEGMRSDYVSFDQCLEAWHYELACLLDFDIRNEDIHEIV
jgi:hypothetical protein